MPFLDRVINKPTQLSDSAKNLLNLFFQNLIAARTIRSLNDLFITNTDDRVSSDLKTELEDHKSGKNSKHEGKHFATTLLVPGVPIELYKHRIGLLFNTTKLTAKRFCLTDAHDDNGTPNKEVKLVNTYPGFVEAIKRMPRNKEGFVQMNELQVFLTEQSRIGIFAVINPSYSHNENNKQKELVNIAAYLKALAFHIFLKSKFKIDLPIFLYDESKGQLLSATRKPDNKTLKLFVTILNFGNYKDIAVHLDSTNKNELEKVNVRLAKRLGIHWTTEEFNELIKKSLTKSEEINIETTITEFNELMTSIGMPNGIRLRFSKSMNCYQMILPFQCCDNLVKSRINSMREKVPVKIFENTNSNSFDINLNSDQIFKIQDYFCYIEPIKFRDEAIKMRSHLTPAL